MVHTNLRVAQAMYHTRVQLTSPSNYGAHTYSFSMDQTLKAIIDVMNADPTYIVPWECEVSIVALEYDDNDHLKAEAKRYSRTCPLMLSCETRSTGIGYLARHTVIMYGYQYSVSCHCLDKKYNIPMGWGNTLYNNNLFMMHPGILQYALPEALRCLQECHESFLFCVSGPTSASLKRMVIFVASQTTCRVCNAGVKDQMIGLDRLVHGHVCNA